jgi:hypothetical protein
MALSRTVAAFEFRQQWREFLPWVYVTIFFFLCFGYLASGAVELVNERGAVPKHAPWALAHATAGVTAFGQLITAMIASTAIMRDVALRAQELLFTTRLTRPAYLAGRFAGALLVMITVYASIPVGFAVGSLASGQPATFVATLRALAVPVCALLLPNVLVVATLFFAVGALRRGFMSILLLGIALIAAWQTGLSLVSGGASWGAFVDPFGNAALNAATAGWSEAERTRASIPLTPFLVLNRVLWLALAAVAAIAVARIYRFAIEAGTLAKAPIARSHTQRPASDLGSDAMGAAPARAVYAAFWADVRWTVKWVAHEKGFLVLALLAALNALLNTLLRDADGQSIAEFFRVHSRVLLIVLATIYAGELVWRDRELRADELRDTLPLTLLLHAGGRLVGLVATLAILAALMAAASAVASIALDAPVLSNALRTGVSVFAFTTQLVLLALLVHVLVQHKVAGHVLLIAGWLVAIMLDRAMEVSVLWRYADLPADAAVGAIAWGELYFSSLGALCAITSLALWHRGAPDEWGPRLRRWRNAGRRLAVPLIALVAIAALAGVRYRAAARAPGAAQYFSR